MKYEDKEKASWQPLNWYDEEKFPSPPKMIILNAVPGATIAKEQNPNLPVTPQEIINSHIEAYKAGASMVHVHVRDERGIPTGDPELYKRVIMEIKDKCPDVIIDCCFAFPMSEDTIEARLIPLCEMGLPIETGTISATTLNIMGRNIYVNREDYLKEAVKYLKKKRLGQLLQCIISKQ